METPDAERPFLGGLVFGKRADPSANADGAKSSSRQSLSLSLSLWRAVGGLARVLLQTDLKCYPQICMPEILLSLPLVRQIPPQSLALEFTGVQISHFITPTFQVSKSQPILTNCYQWPHTPTSSKEYIS